MSSGNDNLVTLDARERDLEYSIPIIKWRKIVHIKFLNQRESIDSIFNILQHYWDILNCSLSENLTCFLYGSCALKQEKDSYQSSQKYAISHYDFAKWFLMIENKSNEADIKKVVPNSVDTFILEEIDGLKGHFNHQFLFSSLEMKWSLPVVIASCLHFKNVDTERLLLNHILLQMKAKIKKIIKKLTMKKHFMIEDEIHPSDKIDQPQGVGKTTFSKQFCHKWLWSQIYYDHALHLLLLNSHLQQFTVERSQEELSLTEEVKEKLFVLSGLKYDSIVVTSQLWTLSSYLINKIRQLMAQIKGEADDKEKLICSWSFYDTSMNIFGAKMNFKKIHFQIHSKVQVAWFTSQLEDIDDFGKRLCHSNHIKSMKYENFMRDTSRKIHGVTVFVPLEENKKEASERERYHISEECMHETEDLKVHHRCFISEESNNFSIIWERCTILEEGKNILMRMQLIRYNSRLVFEALLSEEYKKEGNLNFVSKISKWKDVSKEINLIPGFNIASEELKLIYCLEIWKSYLCIISEEFKQVIKLIIPRNNLKLWLVCDTQKYEHRLLIKFCDKKRKISRNISAPGLGRNLKLIQWSAHYSLPTIDRSSSCSFPKVSHDVVPVKSDYDISCILFGCMLNDCIILVQNFKSTGTKFILVPEREYIKIAFSFYQGFIIKLVATNLARLALILYMLLLQAGDIETNPGPTTLDDQPRLRELTVIPNLETKWMALGLQLSVSEQQLSSIKSKYTNISKCKHQMFQLALKNKITWRQILQALYRIGERATAEKVCQIYEIPAESLSQLMHPDSTKPDLVMADEAILSEILRAEEQPSASIEYQTFLSFLEPLKLDTQSDPIMLANALFSSGIIRQDSLHQLRTLHSDRKKAAHLISLLKDTLYHQPFKFDGFVKALHSIHTHEALADRLSRTYCFNFIMQKLKDYSQDDLDLNYFNTELKISKLISDSVHMKASRAGNVIEMCTTFLTALEAIGLGETFLNHLESFQNTKSVSFRLRDTGDIAKDYASATTKLGKETFSDQKERHIISLSSDTQTNLEGDSDPFLSAVSDNLSPESNSFREFLSSETVLPPEEPHMGKPLPHTFNSGSELTTGSHSHALDHPHSKVLMSTTSGTGSLKGDQLVDLLRGPKKKTQQDKFLAAVKKWDYSQVDSILSSESGAVNVDYLFENDQTALMLAAIEGDENMVQVLLSHKASVTCVDVDGCSPLFHAADKGNYEVVKMLVGHPQTDINLKNKVGVPILLNPAMKGFSMITEYLLEHGAKVDIKSEEDGMTALYGACKRGQRDVVRLLLDHHADVTNVCGKTQQTPLEEATEGEDAEIVKLLMKAVSKANEKSRQLFEVYTPEAVRELIIDGAKVDSRNGCNATPLIVHAQSGHIEVVKMLIRLKANVDLQDNAGFSALIVTAKQGNVEIVQILIAAGAILDLKENQNGYTALMFGIVGGHVNVVKELMLAKSSIFLRNKDGKCAIDLAKECGNAEMRDMIKLHTSTPLGKDPFIHLLSGYMAGKTPSASPKVIQKSIKDVNVNGGAKKAGANAMALVPKSPAIPDESSSVSVELTKCYKRIADLETRVHDLTIMGTMEISDETDLSYMERGRLEAEFKKLKEAKKKAEQYAIEAKQTAQRLSAENLKYREDLSKERHFNELSRKNIMKEVEQEFGKGTRPSEMVMKAQDDIFRQEVREKARELVKNDPKKGQIYERVTMNHDEIRKIIMEQSIRANLLHVAIVGLPYSGKSSLLDAIMKRKSGRIGYSDKFEVCEAVVHISQLDETSDWSLATKFQAEGHALAVVLTQFLARQHKLPSFKNESEVEAVFDDSEIQQYFLLSYSQLKQTISKFEDTDSLDRLVTDSLSFINFYNIGVGKAVYELLIILGGSCRNLLIINVLNLFRDHPDVLRKPVNLGDPKFYEGKYSGEDLELLKLNSALHYYMRAIESGVAHYREGCNTILVGTHADEFESDAKLKERVKQIETMIMGYAEEIGVESVINPDMIAVSNVKESNDYEKMRNILIRLIEERKQFEIDLPMRFLFLRCMLHSTKRLFITENKLNAYAVKCSINLENEIRRFIQIFHDCGSLLHLKTPQRAFIILRPVEFVQNLNRLYYIHSDQSFPKAVIEATECGIISEKLARSLWQGCGYESISLCDFYISILLSIGLMVKLKKSDTAPVYYMPSLCSKCDTAEPDVFSDSLIIDYSISAIPFHMLCGFVNHFQNHDHITLTKSPYCNVVNFAWKSDDGAANITIRFCRQFLEISITDISEGSHSFLASIYSTVKTGCIEVLNKIRSDLVQFRCKYSIICPKSKDKPHFVQFNISDTSEGNLKCIKCDCSEIELSKFPARLLWVQAAYQGNFQSTLHPDDLLTVARLKEISDMILHDSSSDMRELQEFKKFSKISISDQCQNYNTMDEVVFSILYEWRKKVPDATVPKLARILRDCGFYNISLKLDPSLIIMKSC